MYSRIESLFHAWKKHPRWKSWNVTNNKRNLLPLFHGRAPEGENVNDIPRDELDLERKRKREFFKVVENLPWKGKSKREGLVLFCSRNTRKCDFQKLYKTINTRNTVLLLERGFVNMMHHFVRFESDTIERISGRWTFAWRKRTFVNENPPLLKILVTMKPGRDYTVFIRWSKISRGANSGAYRFNKITRSANGELHTRGREAEYGDNPRNPSC